MLLPKSESEIAAMIQNGRRIAKNMSWDVVVTEYLLPTFEKILRTTKAAQLQRAVKISRN